MPSVTQNRSAASIKAAHYFIDYLMKSGLTTSEIAQNIKATKTQVRNIHRQSVQRIPNKLFDNLIGAWCQALLKKGETK